LHATTEPEQSLTDKNNGTVLWPLLHATTEPQQGLTEVLHIKDSGDFNKIKYFQNFLVQLGGPKRRAPTPETIKRLEAKASLFD